VVVVKDRVAVPVPPPVTTATMLSMRNRLDVSIAALFLANVARYGGTSSEVMYLCTLIHGACVNRCDNAAKSDVRPQLRVIAYKDHED
jgi:hypothetical protein